MIPESCRYQELFDAIGAGVLTGPELAQIKTAGAEGTLATLLTTWKTSHPNVAFRGVCERTLALLS